MHEKIGTIPVKRRGIMKHKILPGALVVVGLLAAVEVGLRIIADAHTDPNIRLYALAISGAAGVLVGVLRGGGAAVALLAVSLAAGSAHAADRIRDYDITISTAACPTGAPGAWTDLKTPGLAISGLRAWNMKLCPKTAGAYFTGTGGWRACIYRSGSWTLAPWFYVDMTDDGLGNAVTSTADNPCITYWDIEIGVNDGDLLFIYPDGVGVSSGTQARVVLKGML